MKIKTIYFTMFKAEKKNEASPDWRLMAKTEDDKFIEIGAIWNKEGKNAKYGSGKLSKGLEIVGEVEEYQPKTVEVSEKELDDIPF